MAGPIRTEVELPPLTPAQQEQLQALSHELRCLVCQNQTLADSAADLATDLRNQVHEQVAQGKSDAEIKQYLVDRYGDYVLYNPPVQRNTALLWGGPFALLGIGAASWFVIARRQKMARKAGSPTAEPSSAPDEAALERARKMLDD